MAGVMAALFSLVSLHAALAGETKQSSAIEAKLREQSIYLPYEKLWQTFEKEGRGVFLPYDQFTNLWRAALSSIPRLPKLEPPVPALIAEMSAEAVVAKDVVKSQRRPENRSPEVGLA